MKATKLPDQILVGKCTFFATYLLTACVRDQSNKPQMNKVIASVKETRRNAEKNLF